MKLKHYRKNTYNVCLQYIRNPTSPYYLNRLLRLLERWARGAEKEQARYSKFLLSSGLRAAPGQSKTTVHWYSTSDFKNGVDYCSDRMSSVRARGLLLRYQREQDPIYMFLERIYLKREQSHQ